MQRTQVLLQCQRAAVLLIDDNSEAFKFSKLFELTSPLNGHSNATSHSKENFENASRYMLALAEKVAVSGEVLNVAECLEVEKGSGGDIRSLLAMPIRNSRYQIIGNFVADSSRKFSIRKSRFRKFSHLVLGVATIINKLNGHPFDENDEQLFEAFTIFCGLGIHNTIMYSEVEKAMARQKVAIEVLSYHATASDKELETLMVTFFETHPSLSPSLFSFLKFWLKLNFRKKRSSALMTLTCIR